MWPAEAAAGELFAITAMLRSEHLRSNHRGPLTRWNHSHLRVSKVKFKLWTTKTNCQAISERPVIYGLQSSSLRFRRKVRSALALQNADGTVGEAEPLGHH